MYTLNANISMLLVHALFSIGNDLVVTLMDRLTASVTVAFDTTLMALTLLMRVITSYEIIFIINETITLILKHYSKSWLTDGMSKQF